MNQKGKEHCCLSFLVHVFCSSITFAIMSICKILFFKRKIVTVKSRDVTARVWIVNEGGVIGNVCLEATREMLTFASRDVAQGYNPDIPQRCA